MGGVVKEEKRAADSENLTENGIYYKKLADKYSIAGFVLLGISVVFLLVFCLVGRREIGPARFRYLVKNFNLSLLSADAPYSDISYMAGGVKFAMYRDNLAVIGAGGVELYHPSGELLFRCELGGNAVAVDASGKYMAVYAPGLTSVSLYNSFDKIHTETYEYPVSLAAVGKNCAFAVSLTEGTSSAVYVYDASFRLVYTWNAQSGTVFDISISPDGGKIAVMTLCGASGAYYSELVVKNIKTDKTVAYEKFDGVKPVGVEFFSDGSFFAAVNGTLCFYRSDGEKTAQTSVSSASPQYRIDGNSVVVLTSAYRAVVYSSRGSVSDEISLDGKIFDIDFRDGKLYFLSDSMLYLYHTDTKSIQSRRLGSGALDFFALADGSVLVCFASRPELIVP